MKISREQWRMIIALVLVAVISTILLGITNMLTKAPIAQAQRQALMQALMQVLPEHSNDPITDTFILNPKTQKPITFYISRNQEQQINAIAWETIAPDGYNGSIHILIAVNPDSSIHAIRIIDHQETPGLGDGIVKNIPWIHAFSGKSLSNARWAVRKDGGDFDQFTGATITPRAVVKAVKKALQMFAQSQVLRLASTSEVNHAQ